ncbi:MAG: hypothetical protein JF615_06980, partial [Asticcacaulis sp.]|nr:hypothetical protein [Asticcacaulis sp.]
TWLSADEKAALDRAYDEISDYDRLTVAVPGRKVATWLPSFIARAAVWAGVPVVGLIAWLIVSTLLK